MRAVHSFEIKVGLLVIAGLVATVTMILTADKVRIEKTYVVGAYLQDAGGLRVDSPVTLSGIAIGKVKSMTFVPVGEAAPGRVKAMIKITDGIILPQEATARLATSGVFGDASLALGAPAKVSGTPLATDGSAVLVVTPGFLDRAADQAGGILEAVDDLLSPASRADVKRVVANTAQLTGHAAAVAAKLDAEQERISAILGNLERVSAELVTTTKLVNQRLDPLLAKADTVLGKVDALVSTGTATITDVDLLITDSDAMLTANQQPIAVMLEAVAGAAQKAQRLAALLEGGEGILGQLLVNRDLAKDLHNVSIDLAAASAQVADKPSRLVFDDSESARAADQAKRNREKMRRTLAEGLGQPATAEPAKPAAHPAP